MILSRCFFNDTTESVFLLCTGQLSQVNCPIVNLNNTLGLGSFLPLTSFEPKYSTPLFRTSTLFPRAFVLSQLFTKGGRFSLAWSVSLGLIVLF